MAWNFLKHFIVQISLFDGFYIFECGLNMAFNFIPGFLHKYLVGFTARMDYCLETEPLYVNLLNSPLYGLEYLEILRCSLFEVFLLFIICWFWYFSMWFEVDFYFYFVKWFWKVIQYGLVFLSNMRLVSVMNYVTEVFKSWSNPWKCRVEKY